MLHYILTHSAAEAYFHELRWPVYKPDSKHTAFCAHWGRLNNWFLVWVMLVLSRGSDCGALLLDCPSHDSTANVDYDNEYALISVPVVCRQLPVPLASVVKV